MRDVISNETIKEINEVINEILTNIDDNVRNIQIGEGAGSLPTLLSYTNYDGQTYNIHGSTFTHHIIIDDANGRTTGHIEDGDILTTIGDKNGRQIGAVDEKISGYSNLAYFRESLYSVATDSYGYEIDRRIPFDISRNYDSGITGFSFDIREQYNEHSISNESCTVMTYKLTNIPIGVTFTVTFRGQFHGDFLEDEDSYIVINNRFDETGSTIPMPIGDASVEIIKDDQTHNYSITCSTQFTDLYLHFYFNVDSFIAFDVDSFLVSGMDLGVIRSSFYYDGESYPLLQGGSGTSDLDAIELTYAEYQQLSSAEKLDPDKIYFITDYPDGGSVIEGYLHNGAFYEDAQHTVEIVPDNARIYINLTDDTQYRWSGTVYVQLSKGIALGETSTTAYRGDRGKTAYNHATESGKISAAVSSGLYKIAATAQGHIASATAVVKADITALGIPAQDTTYSVVSKTANGLCPQLPNETTTTKFLRQDGTWSVPPNTNTTYSMTRDGESVKLTPSSGTAQSITLSSLINGLGEGSSPAEADDYLVAQYAGGGTTNTNYYRRKVSNVINAARVKAALGTGSGTSKYLREDGTWQTPPNTNTQMRLYRQNTGYNADYPLIASRTLASSIGTAGTNSSYTAIYGVMWDDTTKIPTLNPSTGEIKAVKFTGAFNGNSTTATTATKLGSSTVGGTTTPIYLNAGTPTALSYTIAKSVPSDAVFTDTKVTQTASTTNSSYEVLFSYTADNTTRTEGARKCSKIKANPSTGLLYSKGIGIDNGQITTVYGVSTITYNGNTISLPSSAGTLALTSDIKIHEIRSYDGTITGDVVRVTHNLGLGTSYKPIVSWTSPVAIVMYGMKNITTNYFEVMFASINGYVIGTATGISVTIRWTY